MSQEIVLTAFFLPLFGGSSNFLYFLEESKQFTVFQNHKKVSFNIASEASYVFTKMPKIVNLTSFWDPEACGRIALPDFNLKTQMKWDILGNFQTLCTFFKNSHVLLLHCELCLLGPQKLVISLGFLNHWHDRIY